LRTGTALHPHKGPYPKLIKHVEAGKASKPRYLRPPKLPAHSIPCIVVRDHNRHQSVTFEDGPRPVVDNAKRVKVLSTAKMTAAYRFIELAITRLQ
jgi:hypothetical protein